MAMSYKGSWGVSLNFFFLWLLCGFYMSANAVCHHGPSSWSWQWECPELLAYTLDPDQNQLRRCDNYIGWALNIYTNQILTLVSTLSHTLPMYFQHHKSGVKAALGQQYNRHNMHSFILTLLNTCSCQTATITARGRIIKPFRWMSKGINKWTWLLLIWSMVVWC